MFSGATPSEYDDIVNKTTDENLTSENWELILNLCDKVQDEGQPGAHAAIAAILKRLAHRNPNVQLYALSLAEALSKNLDIVVHREIASKAFTQGLEKLITDRNTHEKVRKRALGLVATWTAYFEEDSSLGIMEDCYNNLKAKNYKFEQPEETAPPAVDDEIRRKEEEELQRVIEMSMQDRGGRPQWTQYSLAPATSSSTASGPASGSSAPPAAASSSSTAPAPHPFAQPKYPGGGYAPARTPSPVAATPQQQKQRYQPPQTQPQPQPQSRTPNQASSTLANPAASSSAAPTPSPSAEVVTTTTATPAAAAAAIPVSAIGEGTIVTRVRALHTFEPTEAGELAFEKGDVIKVVDRGYKDWWRGQLKGRTGIFPVNYVEAMPEPSATELAKEAEQEAAVFAQAMNVEKLLNMLRALDPAKDNLADDEDIQELYRSCMALRPKVVKLIDKYSQKRADLVSMNETFVRARTIFDRMMEESLARHAGMYEQPYHPSQYPQGRPDSRGGAKRQDYRASQVYGWKPNIFEQPSYGPYPGPANAFPGQLSQDPAGVPVPYGRATPTASGLGPQQQPQPQGYSDPSVSSPYGPVSAPPPGTAAATVPLQHIPGYGGVGQGGYGRQPNVPYSQQGPVPYPAQQQPVQQQLQQQQPNSSQTYQTEPVQTPPIQPQPVQAQIIQPLQPQPVQAQIIQPLQPQPVQAQIIQPLQPQPVQAQPVQQPTQVPHVQQQPAQAQPAQQPTQVQLVQQPAPAQPAQQPTQTQPLQQQLAQTLPVQQDLFSQLEHEQPLQQLPIQAQPEAVQAQTQPQTQILASSDPHSVSPQPQVQPQSQAQPLSQAQPQPQAQAQPQQQQQYIFDPKTVYADPNVQAWAQYYAKGGRDLAGSVYFISIPGLKENLSPPGSTQTNAQQSQQSQQTQQAQQGQQQPQSYQAQPQPSEIERSYSAVTTRQQQEQPSQVRESQFTQQSQYQPQRVQDQILSQQDVQRRSLSLHELENPYKQRQSSVADVEFSQQPSPQQSSPTRSISLGVGLGTRLSSGSFGGEQTGIGIADASTTTGTSPPTPSWVLPKKTPPATVAGGSPSQLRKISLSDPGSVDVLGRNPANQGA